MSSCRMQEGNKESASDMVGGRVVRRCGPCVKKSMSNTAIAYCTDCTDFLCDRCIIVHLSDNLKRHSIVNTKNADSVSRSKCFDMNGMDKCTEHMKEIEFYCESHTQLCCSGCVIKHRTCDKFYELDYYSRQDGNEQRNMDGILLKAQSDTNSMIQQLKQSEDELNGATASLVKEISDIKDRVLQLFDDAQTKLLQEATTITAKQINILNERHKKLMSVQQRISEILNVCSETLTHGTPKQVFIIAKLVENTLKDVNNLKKELGTQLTLNMHITFCTEVHTLVDMDSTIGKLHVNGRSLDRDPFLSSEEIAWRFATLYDNEWTDALERLEEYLREERHCVSVLFDIVMESYLFCEQELKDVWDYARSWFLDENDGTGQRLAKRMLDGRKQKVMTHASDIVHKFKAYLRNHEGLQTSLHTSEMEIYVAACINVCLMMTASIPPIVLECPEWKPGFNIKKTEHSIKQQVFKPEIYTDYTSQGKYVDFYVWPGLRLHQSGPLLQKGVAQGINYPT